MAPPRARSRSSSLRGSAAALSSSKVYVRIRPEVRDGGGHDQDGEPVAKGLEAWDDASVTLSTAYMFSKGSAKYAFPTRVFGPECTQADVYGSAVGPLVERFAEWQGRDVMLLAYGQTGTGKTTTIFGFESALRAQHEAGWGVFPRVCDAVLARMREEGDAFVLTVSALEFYFMGCTDLLSAGGKAPVAMDEQLRFIGHTRTPIREVADVFPAIEALSAARTTRSTSMNAARAEHAGSSRSHCALQLSLARVRAGQLCETSFTLIDLAGAERPGKVREDATPGGVEMMLWNAERTGTVPAHSLSDQTLMINYELFLIGREVLTATAKHRAGEPYAPPRQSTTPFIKLLGACLDGSCELAMIVTLSQAPQNGWETWFSLQYGSDLASLSAPVRRRKARDLGAELRQAEARARETAAAIAGGPPPPNAPAAKYWRARQAAAHAAEERVAWIHRLAAL